MAAAAASFDLRASIEGFLADATCSTMELPRLTTGQRKEAKKLLEQFPQLTCESFGLAEDRRLHLFKAEAQGAAAVAAAAVAADEIAGDDYDVESAVASFVADRFRTVLELPRMTTGQRKLARKIAESHPELTCESYGLASERRLHLFKDGAARAAAPAAEGSPMAGSAIDAMTPAYSVKNTFIDDLVGDAAREPLVFRSIPVRLSALADAFPYNRSNSGCSASLEAPSTVPYTAYTRSNSSSSAVEGISASGVCADERHGRWGSPGASTCASPSAMAVGMLKRSLSNAASNGGDATPAALPEGFHVRNTFICGIDDESADSRIVQSMPHGMFRQCLLEDMRNQASVLGSTFIAPPATEKLCARQPQTFSLAAAVDGFAPQPLFALVPGADVMIQGLMKAPAFNGLVGKIDSWDEETARFKILFPAPVCGQRFAKVKAENLVSAPAPKPPSIFVPLFTPGNDVAAAHHGGAFGMGSPAMCSAR
mmetsp:Transcript_88121/g.248764  ORF Transcript_88121/g.248764 Transcript_88121/m.248764 type:complete len:483 (+) Transcript_88121:57-1505(+)